MQTNSHLGMSRMLCAANFTSYLGGMQGRRRRAKLWRLFRAPLAVSLWHTVSLFKEKWCGRKSRSPKPSDMESRPNCFQGTALFSLTISLLFGKGEKRCQREENHGGLQKAAPHTPQGDKVSFCHRKTTHP